mmetsp:Transcript_21708/g.70115  ORF Transcript_21708/g.70115 Transcript_21708/m.70115 type:complete len:209 (-) Transcript_21708:1691-2317(-)|eukprot:scaffold23343_cov129-Isochrysis_galbana.AAC.3
MRPLLGDVVNGVALDHRLARVALAEQPRVVVCVDLPDVFHRQLLELVDANGDGAQIIRTLVGAQRHGLQGPELTRAAVDLGEEVQRLECRVGRESAQQLRRIVDEEGRPVGAARRRALVELIGEAGAGHFVAQYLLVLRAEVLPRLQNGQLSVGRLSLADEPHQRNSVLALRRLAQPELWSDLLPVVLKMRFVHLRLRVGGQVGEHMK